jgi:hypothetical protein
MTTFDHAVEEQMKAFDIFVYGSPMSRKGDSNHIIEIPYSDTRKFLRSFASTIRDAVREEERERIIQKLQANIWEVSSGFDVESKMHNGIIDHLIKEVRKK